MSEQAWRNNVVLATTADQYRPPREWMRSPSSVSRQENAAALIEFTDDHPWDRPAWHDRAACGRNGVLGDMPAEERVRLFFVARGEPTAQAKEVCAQCTVTEDCERASMVAVGKRFGIWNGKAEKARRQDKLTPCDVCGSAFKPTANGQLYCSDECRKVKRARSQRESQKRRAS